MSLSDVHSIINMTSSYSQSLGSGLSDCFSSFQGAYCTRKLTELITSSATLLLCFLVLGSYLWKYRLQRRLWMTSILASMGLCLLANILFCFYNEQYWLYAVENYGYNLSFLFIVGYVCRAYVLKGRSAGQNNTEFKSREKTIFYAIFIAMTVLQTVIFVVSVVREVYSERNGDSGHVRYCQQVEYLTFDVLCTAMSVLLLIVLHKNQREQRQKVQQYSSIGKSRPRGSLLSDENDKMSSGDESLLKGKVHDPLKTVWIWTSTNVACQIVALIQSGLLLDATPSQCLIINSNPTASNYLDLAFTILTMYMGFAVTLWYAILVGFVRERTGIDRTVTFSQEVKVEGNIELFNPSKEETIFTL